MTRDELLDEMKKEVTAVLPDNDELGGEDIDIVETVVEQVLKNASDSLDGDEDEEEGDVEASAKD